MIGLFNELLSLHPSANVWISLAYGKALPAYRVNAICASLGPDTTRAMPLLHSLIGCACHLLLHGQGKEIRWGSLKVVS